MRPNAPAHLHVVSQDGDGPQIVVVHGAMDRSVSFGRMARHLNGRHLVRYDRRGYARSCEVGVGSMDDHVADLVGVIGDEPAVVLGHSIGGVISLAAAATTEAPVIGIVAYEPPMPWLSWWPRPATDAPAKPQDPADEAEEFMVKMVGEKMWLRLPRSVRQARRAEGEALRADIAAVSAGAPFDPRAIEVPVLAVAGSESSWFHARAVRELADEVPRGDRAVLEGASHGGHLSHPTDLARLLDAFAELGR